MTPKQASVLSTAAWLLVAVDALFLARLLGPRLQISLQPARGDRDTRRVDGDPPLVP